jgi:hypothetical protein
MAAKRFSNSATSGPCSRPHLPLCSVRNSLLLRLAKIGHDVNGRCGLVFLPTAQVSVTWFGF